MKYTDFKHFCTERLLTWGLHSDRFVELSAMLVAHESLGCKFVRQIGGPLINGLASVSSASAYKCYTLIGDGANWIIKSETV